MARRRRPSPLRASTSPREICSGCLKLNAYKLKTSIPHRDALRVEFFDFVLGSRGGRGRCGDFDFDEGFGEGFGVDVA